MSDGDAKLLALLKSFEAQEHSALRERLKVEEVVSTREKALVEAEEKQQQLIKRIADTRGASRFAALHGGALGSVRIGALFSIRLDEERLRLEGVITRLKEDLHRARERFSFVESEVIQARIDRKRIETLLGNRALARQAVDEHLQEVQSEELRTLSRKGKT